MAKTMQLISLTTIQRQYEQHNSKAVGPHGSAGATMRRKTALIRVRRTRNYCAAAAAAAANVAHGCC